MKIFTYLCAILLIFLGVSFSLLNAGSVTVNYLLGSLVLPVSFLIVISVAIGALLGMFFCMFSLLRQKANIRGLRKKVESLEKITNATANDLKE